MSNYAFSDFYKSGAQIIVSVNGFPLLEAVGISYSVSESKLPIYGYSSRHFDAVGHGQVLVQGTLVCNWVHQDYLYWATQMVAQVEDGGLSLGGSTGGVNEFANLSPTEAAAAVEQSLFSLQTGEAPGDGASAQSLEETLNALKQSFWSNLGSTGNTLSGQVNPHDLGGISLVITAGQISETLPNGDWGVLLSSLHFTGRGKQIQVSEDVILESYQFIARNELSLKYSNFNPGAPDTAPIVTEPNPEVSAVTDPQGEETSAEQSATANPDIETNTNVTTLRGLPSTLTGNYGPVGLGSMTIYSD